MMIVIISIMSEPAHLLYGSVSNVLLILKEESHGQVFVGSLMPLL